MSSISAYSRNWIFRNRLLSLLLMIYSIVHFSCFIRSAKGDAYKEIWCAASLLLLLGASLVMLGLYMDFFDLILRTTAMFALLFGGALLMAAGAVFALEIMAKECTDSVSCVCWVFGEKILIPTMTAWSIAFDLDLLLRNDRLRVTVYSGGLAVNIDKSTKTERRYQKQRGKRDHESSLGHRPKVDQNPGERQKKEQARETCIGAQ